MRCWLWAQPGKVSGKRWLGHGLPSDSFLAIRLVAVWANGRQLELLLSCRQNELTGSQGSEVVSGLLYVTVAKEQTQTREAFTLIITFFFLILNKAANQNSYGLKLSFKLLDCIFFFLLLFFRFLTTTLVPCCQYLGPLLSLTPNLQSRWTAFFWALSPPELQSFLWPAHTCLQLHREPALPVIQRLLLMARQRLLSPAMRTEFSCT